MLNRNIEKLLIVPEFMLIPKGRFDEDASTLIYLHNMFSFRFKDRFECRASSWTARCVICGFTISYLVHPIMSLISSFRFTAI
jgi:hypothetical protein